MMTRASKKSYTRVTT